MQRKLKYIIPAILLISAVSCKKALDINTDPGRPLAAPVSKLLPTAQVNLGISQTISGGLSEVLEVYAHRMSTRESPNQYGSTGDDFNIGTNWTGVYISTLTNLDAIISQGTADGNFKYAGIAQILKAYSYSQLVDTYGDVPFTEVNMTGNLSPVFDKGSDIYPKLFDLLNSGIENLNNPETNPFSPAADDIIYKGSVDKWVRAANSIKLKLLLQQRLIKDVSVEVNALIAGGKLISQTSESFLIPFGPNGATDDRNPGFNDYFASQRGNYISPWFYEILKGYNPSINTGIKDPRIPYYFFNQLKATAEATNPTDYRDSAFVSIYFGSQGDNAAQNQQNNMTVLGIYPVGGKYDDKSGGVVSATSGTGAAPYRLITYADILYIKAELMKTGVITGDAAATLQLAITESFKQVDYVITTYVKPTQTVPVLAGTAPVTSYITKVMAEYNSPRIVSGYGAQNADDKKLEIIMTQKWISSFGSALDTYIDYRRTGYPTLFDPTNPAMAPGGLVQPPVNGDPTLGGPQEPIRVIVNKAYPQTLPWYTSELERNTKAPAQKNDPSTYKPFWKP
ncbi:MAG: SusD/RagB family nutrient-binding outer membrane lipoprotein [Pedobacter sp.]|nr:MAG: SusD/RagB family nutrient-binding outer membrane lipoprotein [Pedobacter sp.]